VARNGKGGKDRIVPLPERLRAPLESHLERVKALHDRDLAAGAGSSPTHWRQDGANRPVPRTPPTGACG
jgi:hypothetical protein